MCNSTPICCLPCARLLLGLLCAWLLCACLLLGLLFARHLPQLQILLQLSIVNTRRPATRLTCHVWPPGVAFWQVHGICKNNWLEESNLFCANFFIMCHCLTPRCWLLISLKDTYNVNYLYMYNVQCVRVKRVTQEIRPEVSLLPVNKLFSQYLQSIFPWNLYHSSYFFFFNSACFFDKC